MKHFLTKLGIGVVSCLFTFAVFGNAYEVLANKDIPLGWTLKRFSSAQTLDSLRGEYVQKTIGDRNTSLSVFQTINSINIPALSAHATLEEARIVDETYYLRSNVYGYFSLNKDTRGTPADYVVYGEASWFGIPNPNQIENGMDIDLFFDGGSKSAFQVKEKSVVPPNGKVVFAQTEERQIILLLTSSNGAEVFGFSLVQKV